MCYMSTWHDYISVFKTKCHTQNGLVGSQRDYREPRERAITHIPEYLFLAIQMEKSVNES